MPYFSSVLKEVNLFNPLTRERISMKKLIACLAAIVLSCGILAGCGSSVTPESVAQKAETVQTKIIELGQKDPEKLLKVTQEMQTKLPDLQKANNLEAIDKFYDEVLEMMK